MQILTIAGSLRADSFNRRLLGLATERLEAAGATVTTCDLRELALPLLDQDWEAEHGLPAGGARLREALAGADGVLIASPEYNGSLTAALKNAIDWSTRDGDGGGDTGPWQGRVVALCSASPGAYGGMRGLGHLRTVLAGIGALVLPGTLSVPQAHKALDDPDEGLDKRLGRLVDGLLDAARRHRD